MRTIGIILFHVYIFISVQSAFAKENISDIVYPKTIKHAPEFSLKTLSGGDISLSDFKGKLVLLHFWSTTCLPCLKEMPSLQKLSDEMDNEDFSVIAVAVDRDGPEKVRRFIDQYQITLPILLDPEGGVRNSYEVIGLPFSYLIDKKGDFVARIIGTRDWSNHAYQ